MKITEAQEQQIITIRNLRISNTLPFILIAGPCVLESRAHALEMAEALKAIAAKEEIGLIFKSSFDKANRTSIKGYRGIGLEESLSIFAEIQQRFELPILTDVHEAEQCHLLSEVVDVLQIPAFLCRQTDLLLAAGRTGKVINVKKGQFLAPWDTHNIVKKIEETGNSQVMLCERGASFGYNNLVTDMRSLPIMAQTGCPIIFDATHSVQQPGGHGTSTAGDRRFVPVLARAAVAVGVAGVFTEVHEDPDRAPSDGPNMLKLSTLPSLLSLLKEIDTLAKKNPIVL